MPTDELMTMYHAGQQAFSESNYALAESLLRAAAERGHPNAQFELGQMYEIGTGVPLDYEQSFYWYSKAAAQGLAPAQNRLSAAYTLGRGVAPDYRRAVEWLSKAAEQGDADSQGLLGTLYVEGVGVPQDDALARKWLTMASDQGIANAQLVLDSYYPDPVNGPRVPEGVVPGIVTFLRQLARSDRPRTRAGTTNVTDGYVEAVNRAREMLVWSPLSLPRIAEALEEAMAHAKWAGDPRADNIKDDVLSVVEHAQALFEKAKRAGDCRIQQFERTEALVASGLGIGEIGGALSKETEEAKRAGVLRIESPFFDEAEETIGKAEKLFWQLFGSEENAMALGPDDDWLKDWRVTDD